MLNDGHGQILALLSADRKASLTLSRCSSGAVFTKMREAAELASHVFHPHLQRIMAFSSYACDEAFAFTRHRDGQVRARCRCALKR